MTRGEVGTQTSHDNPHIPASEIDLAREDIGDWASRARVPLPSSIPSRPTAPRRSGSIGFPGHRGGQPTSHARLPGNRRVISADLGEGTGRDRTVIGVVDNRHHPLRGVRPCRYSRGRRQDRPTPPIAWVRQEHITYDAGGRGKDLPRYLEQWASPRRSRTTVAARRPSIHEQTLNDGLVVEATSRPRAARKGQADRVPAGLQAERMTSAEAATAEDSTAVWSAVRASPGGRRSPKNLAPPGTRWMGRRSNLRTRKTWRSVSGRSPDIVDMLDGDEHPGE